MAPTLALNSEQRNNLGDLAQEILEIILHHYYGAYQVITAEWLKTSTSRFSELSIRPVPDDLLLVSKHIRNTAIKVKSQLAIKLALATTLRSQCDNSLTRIVTSQSTICASIRDRTTHISMFVPTHADRVSICFKFRTLLRPFPHLRVLLGSSRDENDEAVRVWQLLHRSDLARYELFQDCALPYYITVIAQNTQKYTPTNVPDQKDFAVDSREDWQQCLRYVDGLDFDNVRLFWSYSVNDVSLEAGL